MTACHDAYLGVSSHASSNACMRSEKSVRSFLRFRRATARSKPLIFRIHVHFCDAGLWAGVVRRSVPCMFEQLHTAQFLNRDTAPVSRRTGRRCHSVQRTDSTAREVALGDSVPSVVQVRTKERIAALLAA
jgi:hypothetical protein